MYRLLTSLLLLFSFLIFFVKALPNGDALGGECTEGFITVDRIDRLQRRTGSVVLFGNLQVIYPEVGFTCEGTLRRVMFGAGDVNRQRTERPLLQIWRPVGDTTYMLVNQSTLQLSFLFDGVNEYTLPSPINYQAGDVIGFYQPTMSMSHFRIMLESARGDDLQCSYNTAGPTNLLSNISVNGFQLDCNFQVFLLPTTDCGCGFMSMERMGYVLDSSNVPSTTTSIDQRQQISPDMRFTYDGFITKWTIMAQYVAVANSLYPELQIWRNTENSTVYEKISGVSITMPLRQFSGVYEFDNFTPIAVKSGDILGISIPDVHSSRLQLLSEINNTPIQYYIPIDPSSSSSYDVIDIQSSLVTSSAYQPLVSVEFVKGLSSVKVITPITEACASGSVCVCVGEEVGTAGLSPSSESSQRSSVGVCVGAGVGVALASIVAVLLVAIVIVILVVVVRRKQTSKKEEVEETKDSRNTMDNPTYCGTVTRGVQGEAVYEVPTESDERSGCDIRPRTTTNGSHAYAEFDNPLYQPN